MTKAIIVFTAKSVDTILAEGGSSAWRLDRNNARQCTYVVCSRNAYADWTEGTEPHHAGFLIGRISDVVDAPNRAGRFLIKMSEYALIDMPEVWKSGDRNPLKYKEFEALGIDVAKLKWKKMPDAVAAKTDISEGRPRTHNAVGALTMAQAKQGLALTFGVQPEAIEITIRG